MSLTHRWERGASPSQDLEVIYSEALTDARRLVDESPVALNVNRGAESEPTAIGLSFNGVSKDAGDPFALPTTYAALGCRGSCQTCGRPYDIVVKAVLAIVRHHLGSAFIVIPGDGPSEWVPDVMLARWGSRSDAVQLPLTEDDWVISVGVADDEAIRQDHRAAVRSIAHQSRELGLMFNRPD